jgi:hypothetical protein
LATPEARCLGYPKPLLAGYYIAIEFGHDTKVDPDREAGGTTFWKAPEVIADPIAKNLSARTDIWNVWINIWETMHSSFGITQNDLLCQTLSVDWLSNPRDDAWTEEDIIVGLQLILLQRT